MKIEDQSDSFPNVLSRIFLKLVFTSHLKAFIGKYKS